jgi:hypothetical protein
MPRGKGPGGPRQGTPGKGYSNRTDLASNMDMSKNTAASGGMTAPAPDPGVAQLGQPEALPMPAVGADDIPNLTDPTQRPDEPVMAGVPLGAGPGPEAMGPMPPNPMDPTRQIVQALMDLAPSPDLARILNRLDFEGR